MPARALGGVGPQLGPKVMILAGKTGAPFQAGDSRGRLQSHCPTLFLALFPSPVGALMARVST